jgi:hypothetical protein
LLENEGLSIELLPDASLRLIDKSTGVKWTAGPAQLVFDGQDKQPVQPLEEIDRDGDVIRFLSEEGSKFELHLLEDPPGVEYSVEPGPGVEEVLLLDSALSLREGKDNYYAIPHRLGVLWPLEGEKDFSWRFKGYDTSGYSMAMFGAVQGGSALLLSWEDPHTDILVDYVVEPSRRLTMALSMSKSARSVRMQPIGRGGYVEIAKAYRPIARERGFLKTLAEKVRENPDIEKFFGAADFKPFAYMPVAPNTRWNKSDEWEIQLKFTFEECAQLAEHFANDLGIDRAMMVLNGWINGGYDNLHPDILPAAKAIGGNKGLVDCSNRVKKLNWLFGLHDNYQDMYQAAKSWDESFLMKLEDGTPRKGGVWAGGPCWLICSQKSLGLASRPQNVPGVHELCDPDLYFSDTIFATPLYECHDPNHLLTRVDDMIHKQKLSDYIRGVVGLFGSEEGREWGVAHTDYFEGLMSHKTRYWNPNDPAIIIPLFELVFSDAIPLYAHQSNRPQPDMPEYILDHILYAEMPVYYFGEHRYYLDPERDFKPEEGSKFKLVFAQGGRFGLIDQFIKNTYEVLSPLGRLTALMEMTDHKFLSADRKVESTRFGADVQIVVNYGESDFTYEGVVLPQYGFLVTSPSLVAFYARQYGGVTYSEPSMFVMTSLNELPLADSKEVRIYRAFGENHVQFRGSVEEVDAEKIIKE